MTDPLVVPPDPPPVTNPPAGQNCVSCKFGITRSFGGETLVLECRDNPPNIFQGYLARWPQVAQTDWCGHWATK